MLTNHTIRSLILFVAALAWSGGAAAEDAAAESVVAGEQGAGTLTVEIRNIPNAKGQVGCSLYSSKDGFPSDPDKAAKQVFVKHANGKATCVFKAVKPGTYAVSAMHDENKDRALETSFVGRPQEWWGVSNDVPAERFGPPKYEKATFNYDGSAKTIKIKLQL